MYQVLTKITITQIPSKEFPDRNLVLEIPFLAEFEIESTWQNLTETMRLVLPKRVRYNILGRKRKYNLQNQNGQDSNVGGFTEGVAPAFRRGDMIKLEAGYRAKLADGSEEESVNLLFDGFISGVDGKLRFTLDCQNAMWLLKQVPTPVKQWPRNYTLQQVLKDTLAVAYSVVDGEDEPILQKYKKYGVEITVSKFSETNLVFNVGTLVTHGESVAKFLDNCRTRYKIISYLRNNELRVGLGYYIPSEAVSHSFSFQRNIIEDDLKYSIKTDVNLSVVVKSLYTEANGLKRDGSPKTKTVGLSILVFADAKGQFKYQLHERSKGFPANLGGERYTYYVDGVKDPEKLFELGKAYLQRYYYTGLRGGFLTFGIPYVKHGDTVSLVDNVLPEREGTYQVKKVIYLGGYDKGLKQRVELDYRIH